MNEEEPKVRVTFLGATRCTTGSCYYIEAAEKKFLVDCGLHVENPDSLDRHEVPSEIDPATLDFVILTEPSISRCALLPKIHSEGFTKVAYCRKSLRELFELCLLESGENERQRELWFKEKGERKGVGHCTALYDQYQAARSLELLEEVDDGCLIPTDDGKVAFQFHGSRDSTSIELIVKEGGKEERLVFFSDEERDCSWLLPGKPSASYLFLLGKRSKVREKTQSPWEEKLIEAMQSCNEENAPLLIPCSMGRTMKLLLPKLLESWKAGKLTCPSVVLDSPLASRYIEKFKLKGMDARVERSESIALNEASGPRAIISGDSSCNKGRIQHHLKHNLWSRGSKVIFFEEQAFGTIGRRLLDGCSSIQLFGERIRVMAEVLDFSSSFEGFENKGIESFLEGLDSFDKIFLQGGEEDILFDLEDFLEDKWPGSTYVPNFKEELDLSKTEGIKELSTVREAPDLESSNVEQDLQVELEAFERSVELSREKLSDLVTALEAWAKQNSDNTEAVRGCAIVLERIVANLTALGMEGVEGTERTIVKLAQELAKDSPKGSIEAISALRNVRSTLEEASDSADSLLGAF